MLYGIDRIDGSEILPPEHKSVKTAVEYAVEQGISLQLANLRCANLPAASLKDANLLCANLRCAYLQFADLRRADLREADFWWANLRGANLRWANLQEANLRWANLQEANLRGVNLQGADLWRANLWRADLWNVTGNGKEIKTISVGQYIINYTADRLQIGCENHSLAEWQAFTDRDILDFGKYEDFDIWREHKALIFDIISRFPATPTWHEEE